MDSRSFERRGLLICVFIFLSGGALGAYFAHSIDRDVAFHIFELCRSGIPALYAVILNLSLPVLTLFLSTSVIGYVLIPPLDFTGGFIASYIMTAVLAASGITFYSIAYLAVPAFLGAACQLFLSARCMLISLSIGREKRGTAVFGRRQTVFAAPAALIMLTAAEIIFYRFTR